MGCLLFNCLQKNLSKYVPQFIFSREKLVKLMSLFCCRMTNDRKTKHAAKTELTFANSQLDALKEELEGINSTLDVYQFDRCVKIETSI